jgi:hypothetical protein
MASASQPDHGVLLQSFLLRRYISLIRSPLRTREERLESRMELESFLLSSGPAALRELQRTLSFEADKPEGIPVLEWFVEFLTSRNAAWLEQLDVRIIQRYWRIATEPRSKDRAIELIAKAEWVVTQGRGAPTSEIVLLFREHQEQPFSEPMNPRADDIVRTLIGLASSSSNRAMYEEDSLGRYVLRVLSYCFRDSRTDMGLAQDRVEEILRRCAGLTNEQDQWFREILAI